ncbi:MAG: cupin domain-containing protein [Candidatus Saccharimonadales bacterium]
MINRSIFTTNIEQEVLENTDYRRVVNTFNHAQLVYMSLEPGVEIGNEIHGIDQFIRIERGNAKASVNNDEQEYELANGSVIMVPAGTWHNIINTGDEPVKLYTIYSGPQHLHSTVQPTKADEEEDHFNGITDLDD